MKFVFVAIRDIFLKTCIGIAFLAHPAPKGWHWKGEK
jgi:hypothetical protein